MATMLNPSIGMPDPYNGITFMSQPGGGNGFRNSGPSTAIDKFGNPMTMFNPANGMNQSFGPPIKSIGGDMSNFGLPSAYTEMPQMPSNIVHAPGMAQNSGFQGYNPSPINATGSYNTGDYASLLGGLFTGGVAGAAAGAGVNDAVARLQALGESGVNDYTNLAKTVTQDVNFKPYALTNSLGSTRQTAPGVIDQQ